MASQLPLLMEWTLILQIRIWSTSNRCKASMNIQSTVRSKQARPQLAVQATTQHQPPTNSSLRVKWILWVVGSLSAPYSLRETPIASSPHTSQKRNWEGSTTANIKAVFKVTRCKSKEKIGSLTNNMWSRKKVTIARDQVMMKAIQLGAILEGSQELSM